MNKYIAAAAAAAVSMALATPAMAQQAESRPTWTANLDAEVRSICGVYRFSGISQTFDFADLADTASSDTVEQGATLNYRCNSANGIVRTIVSTNDGKLLRDGTITGAGNEIPYEMNHTVFGGGTNAMSFAYQSLAGGKTDAITDGLALLAGLGAVANFKVPGVKAPNGNNQSAGTTVFAGDYSDTVVITVTAQ